MLSKLSNALLVIFVIVVPLAFLHQTSVYSLNYLHSLGIFGAFKELIAQYFTWILLSLLVLQSAYFKKDIEINTIFVITFLFLVYQALSLMWSHHPYQGFEYWRHWISLAAFLFVCFHLLDKTQNIHRLLQVALATAFIICGISIVTYYLQTDLPFFHNRPFRGAATFGNPKFAAEYIAPLIFWSLALFSIESKMWRKMTYIAVSILFLGSLLFVYHSRAALIGILVCLGFAVVFFGFRKSLAVIKSKNVVVLLITLVIASGILFTQTFKHTTWNKRFIALLQTKSGSTQQRVVVWKNTLKVIKNNFWVGTGIGNFNIIFPSYPTPQDRYRLPADGPWNNFVRQAHNEYLQLFSELGLLGVLMASLVLLFICFLFFNFIKQKKPTDHFMFFMFLSFLCTCGIAFFTFNLQNTASSFFLIITIAILMRTALNNHNMTTKKGVRIPKAVALLLVLIFFIPIFLTTQDIVAIYYKYQGRSYAATRDLRAISRFKDSLKWNPHDWETHFQVGQAYYDHMIYAKATSHFEKALELNPFNPSALYNLGLSYEGLNNNSKAHQIYHRLLRDTPDFRLATVRLGYMAVAQKDCDRAKKYFRSSLMPAAYQKFVFNDALNGLALCNMRAGNYERAHHELLESFLLNPGSQYNLKNLMNSWIQMNRK